MKICMLISKTEPSDDGVYVGGSVNSLLVLVKYLVSENVVVRLITSISKEKRYLLEKYKPEGPSLTVFTNQSRPQSLSYGVVFLLKVLLWALATKKKEYDIVHGHSGYAIYAWVTYLSSILLKAKCVHTVYCPLEAKGTVDNRKKIILKGKMAVRALNKMDKVFAMSSNIEKSMINAGVLKSKITVMPTAIDTEKFAPHRENKNEIRNKLHVEEDKCLVLFVGNLMRSKGVDVLVEAFGKIASSSSAPSMKLVLTLELKHSGFEEREKELKDRISVLGLDDRVVYLGMIDYMPDLIAESDIIVSPYRDTQGPSDYPLIMMEAMAAGKCVVGTTVGGIPELIDDHTSGRLVPPDDSTSLAQVLAELVENASERNRLGEGARARILSHYSAQHSVERHLSAYQDILRN